LHPAGDDLVPCCAASLPGSAGVVEALPKTDDLESVRPPAGTPVGAAVQRASAHLASHVDLRPCRSARHSAGQHHVARALIGAGRLPHAPAAHRHPQPGLTHLHMHPMSHILSLRHPAGQMAAAAVAAAAVPASELLIGIVVADAAADQAGHLAC